MFLFLERELFGARDDAVWCSKTTFGEDVRFEKPVRLLERMSCWVFMSQN